MPFVYLAAFVVGAHVVNCAWDGRPIFPQRKK